MSFDLTRILDGKRALRRTLAARPVAEKLAMLDVLRDRVRTIRSATRPIPGRRTEKARSETLRGPDSAT
jgi:hypothetical protein